MKYLKSHSATIICALLMMCATGAAQPNKKFEYSILVDSTGSMRSQFSTVVTLAKGVVRQVHKHGPVSVFCFQSEGIGRASRALATARVVRSQDEDQLNRAIDGIYIEGGQTALLDAVETIAENLGRPPVADVKIIILITDGEDRVSQERQKDLIGKLAAGDTRVYAIGLTRELEGSKRSHAIDLLKALTKNTGGRAVFPKDNSVDVNNVLTELSLPIQ
jgi:von Willebrand factor type A domain-containing protein